MVPIRFKAAPHLVTAMVLSSALSSGLVSPANAQALSSIQGVLRTDTGQPVNGANVLRFSLYSTATGGTPLQEVTQTLDVAQGVFSAAPDFDPQLFGSTQERWVEIGVRTGPGTFETLTPRQQIGAAPMALTIPGLQVTSAVFLDQTISPSAPITTTLLNNGIRWQSFTTAYAGEVRAIEDSFRNLSGTDATITAKLFRGLGADGTPVAVTTAVVPANTTVPVKTRFTFAATATASAQEVFTVQLSSPSPIEWLVSRNNSYSRGTSNFEPDADYPISTYISSRTAGATFAFGGTVSAPTVSGSNGVFSGGVTASVVQAGNANFTGNITADNITANSFNVPILTSSLFLGQSMALTTNAGIGLTNPSSDVRLEILKQNVGSGWHMYLTNPTAQAQFNRTGMRVSDVGFFEITPAIGSGQFARLSGAGNWSAVSDARLKSDVSPADGLLDAALKLRPVNFRWIADGKRDTGFIAQDVKGILPRFVIGDEKKDMLTVDYSHMSVVAIGAIQEMHRELKAENEALRAELLNQTARRSEDASEKQREIDVLKARLERLESVVMSKAPATK